MIFIKINDKNEITYRNFQPFDEKNGLGKTRAMLLYEGHLVDSIPPVDYVEGKTAIQTYNPVNGEFKTIYRDFSFSPIDQTSEIEELKLAITRLESMSEIIEEQSVALIDVVAYIDAILGAEK